MITHGIYSATILGHGLWKIHDHRRRLRQRIQQLRQEGNSGKFQSRIVMSLQLDTGKFVQKLQQSSISIPIMYNRIILYTNNITVEQYQCVEEIFHCRHCNNFASFLRLANFYAFCWVIEHQSSNWQMMLANTW